MSVLCKLCLNYTSLCEQLSLLCFFAPEADTPEFQDCDEATPNYLRFLTHGLRRAQCLRTLFSRRWFHLRVFSNVTVFFLSVLTVSFDIC